MCSQVALRVHWLNERLGGSHCLGLSVTNAGGMRAGELYDLCSAAYSSYSHSDRRDAEYRRCSGYVNREFSNDGFIFASEAEDPVTVRLRKVCPRSRVSPMEGPWVMFVHYWDQNGMGWSHAAGSLAQTRERSARRCERRRGSRGAAGVLTTRRARRLMAEVEAPRRPRRATGRSGRQSGRISSGQCNRGTGR
jgi:hypothetical protein